MNSGDTNPNPLHQLWQLFLQTSQVAVAIRYAAPWQD